MKPMRMLFMELKFMFPFNESSKQELKSDN